MSSVRQLFASLIAETHTHLSLHSNLLFAFMCQCYVRCSNRYGFRLIAIGNLRVYSIIILVVTRLRSNGLDCVRSLSDKLCEYRRLLIGVNLNSDVHINF